MESGYRVTQTLRDESDAGDIPDIDGNDEDEYEDVDGSSSAGDDSADEYEDAIEQPDAPVSLVNDDDTMNSLYGRPALPWDTDLSTIVDVRSRQRTPVRYAKVLHPNYHTDKTLPERKSFPKGVKAVKSSMAPVTKKSLTIEREDIVSSRLPERPAPLPEIVGSSVKSPVEFSVRSPVKTPSTKKTTVIKLTPKSSKTPSTKKTTVIKLTPKSSKTPSTKKTTVIKLTPKSSKTSSKAPSTKKTSSKKTTVIKLTPKSSTSSRPKSSTKKTTVIKLTPKSSKTSSKKKTKSAPSSPVARRDNVTNDGIESLRVTDLSATVPDLIRVRAVQRPSIGTPKVVMPVFNTTLKAVIVPTVKRPTSDAGKIVLRNDRDADNLILILGEIDTNMLTSDRTGKNKKGYSLGILQGFAKRLGITVSGKRKQELIDGIYKLRKEFAM